MAKRRIRTRKDLNLAMSVLPRIEKLGDEIAKTIKKLPLNLASHEESVITKNEEALLMHFLVFAIQNAELAICVEGILKSDDKEEEERLRGYKGFFLAGLADCLFRAKKLCELLGKSLEYEVMPLGEARNKEKREEYLRKHPEGTWY